MNKRFIIAKADMDLVDADLQAQTAPNREPRSGLMATGASINTQKNGSHF